MFPASVYMLCSLLEGQSPLTDQIMLEDLLSGTYPIFFLSIDVTYFLGTIG